ncbi:MAG: sensor histidine kinase [Burkholderiaceae bacterium]|nr:sensor histidine kinase [Burkholderiaceae bacterium]
MKFAAPTSDTPAAPPPQSRRFAQRFLPAFHGYAGWLVSISWWRFLLLSLLLLIVSSILGDMLPSWSYETDELLPPPKRPVVTIEAPSSPASGGTAASGVRLRQGKDSLEITIDEKGVRVLRRPAAPASAAGALPTRPPASAGTAASGTVAGQARPLVEIHVPPGVAADAVRKALEEAHDDIEEALLEAAAEAADAAEAGQASPPAAAAPPPRYRRVRVAPGDGLPQLAFLWILGSAILKSTYRRQIQAEAAAARANETARAEQLERQVVEARMAAMQAQVEPHFLFNTLASIDHLIETDPPRASQMQKHLIALLRASLPSLRESNGSGTRTLGQEMAVIRPYLEILKVRMEERLRTEFDVPDGLSSAELPPMMLQSLVENAIKHGLEPKAEGGTLRVQAEIRHGQLVVAVSDTGLGWGRAPTAGTGTGLNNIRERLQLLYGSQAALQVAENPGGGSIVRLLLPYRTRPEPPAGVA